MDARDFDTVTRALAGVLTRRRVVGLLGGLGLSGLIGHSGAEAKHKKKKKHKKPTSPPSPPASPPPQTGCVRTCNGKACGNDGCGGSCGTCQGNKTCQGGICACPGGEIECLTNICVPQDAQCCTDGQCSNRQVCLHGQCVTWQDTCPAGSDSCGDTPAVCGGNQCGCYQSTEGDTRCGTALDALGQCEVCQTSADCVALYPTIPGVFCRTSGTQCCSGTCRKPCPL
jgi:hypothetical protein